MSARATYLPIGYGLDVNFLDDLILGKSKGSLSLALSSVAPDICYDFCKNH